MDTQLKPSRIASSLVTAGTQPSSSATRQSVRCGTPSGCARRSVLDRLERRRALGGANAMAGQVPCAAQRRVTSDQQALSREEVDGREVDLLLARAGDRDRVDREVDLSALDGWDALVGRQRPELQRVRVAEDRPGELMRNVDLEPGEPLGQRVRRRAAGCSGRLRPRGGPGAA